MILESNWPARTGVVLENGATCASHKSREAVDA